MAREATHHVKIPMHGMAQSLNVSVAMATVLYEAERQRWAAGMYESVETGFVDSLVKQRTERELSRQ